MSSPYEPDPRQGPVHQPGGYQSGGYPSGGYQPGGQQPAGYGAPAGDPPPSNLVWGIITIVFCGGGFIGLVAGIVSIVNATQVSSKWAMGDQAGALEASRKAKTWAIWGVLLSLLLLVLFIGVVAALGMSGALDESSAAGR